MSALLDAVDIVFSLTESGKPAIVEAFPELSRASVRLARHPHYRDFLSPIGRSRDIRDRLGVAPGQRVLSFLGTMRPDKRPDLLSTAFAELPARDYFLVMAGACSPELAATLSTNLRSNINAHLWFNAVTQNELLDLYRITDISIFPAPSYFNSGTIYTSLSLNVPVIVARSPQTFELQRMVGSEWLFLYDGNLSSEILEAGTRHAIHRTQETVCDLGVRSVRLRTTAH